MNIGIAPVITSKLNRRHPRNPGLFENTLDAAGPRGMLVGYLVAGVIVALFQNTAPDSILTWFVTWLVVLLWPVVVAFYLTQLIAWAFVVLACVVTAMFVIPYIVGMVVLSWQASVLRRHIINVIHSVSGHA